MSTDQVSELLLRWEDARRRGESVTLDQLCRDCPEHLAELRERVAALASMESLLDAGPDTSAPTLPPFAKLAAPGPLSPAGRYRPVRAHAQGGLGEVLVAEDGELRRPVALKRIRDSRADDPDSRRRFLREAEITARLQHPGVVPVYGLTHDERGRPNYAMRFVEGESLADALQRFHAPGAPADFRGAAFRDLLARFVQVCNTIAYAHSRGVLHRDLKPANVMLGGYGETLVVDWGLAKSVGEPVQPESAVRIASPADSTADGLTATGQALGTPAYMSPEQAAGAWDELGPASDVFGLGAVLYALLAGQAPYQGRYGVTVLEKARNCDFPPPRSVRPGVPAALEAVCLKAMARAPAARYASALDLAADVGRWLADEPVTAYRDPWRERLRRWAKRHRPLVAGAVVLVLTAAVALAVLTVQSERSKRAIAQQRDTARDERNRAVAARVRTRAALDQMTSPIARQWLAAQKKLSPQQEAFLKTALQYYQQFAAEDATDPEGQTLLVKAHSRVGEILEALGQLDQADTAYHQAIELAERLADQHPDAPAYRYDLAVNLSNWSHVLTRGGKLSDAEAAARRAIGLYDRLVADHPADPAYARDLANALNNLAIVQNDLGRRADAVGTHQRALALRERLLQEHPDEPLYREQLAVTSINLATVLGALGRHAETLAAGQRALDLYDGLARDYPYEPDYRRQLANALNNHSAELRRAGHATEAEANDRRALGLYERLAEEFPGVPEHRQQLALSLCNLAIHVGERGNHAEATALCRRALDLYDRLVRDNPGVPLYRQEQARAYHNLAEQLNGQGLSQEAESAHRRSQELFDRLIEEHPDVPDYREEAASNLNNYALLLAERGDVDTAEDAHLRALALCEKLTSDYPDVPLYCRIQAAATNNLGKLAVERKDTAAALNWYAKSVSVLEPVVTRDPQFTAARSALRLAHREQAAVLFNLDRFAESVPHWDRVVELAGDAIDRESLMGRMIALARAGDLARATAAADTLASAKTAVAADLYDCACIYALASGAGPTPTVGNDRQADRAVELFLQAVARGYKDVAQIKKDTDLDPLRKRADFQKLLADLDKPPPGA